MSSYLSPQKTYTRQLRPGSRQRRNHTNFHQNLSLKLAVGVGPSSKSLFLWSFAQVVMWDGLRTEHKGAVLVSKKKKTRGRTHISINYSDLNKVFFCFVFLFDLNKFIIIYALNG
jgi:hypothetical protein